MCLAVEPVPAMLRARATLERRLSLSRLASRPARAGPKAEFIEVIEGYSPDVGLAGT